ncbi:DsbA family protein [Roseibium sp. RKSG952]|uniref:DsbA family protein n=1 Tax=Roseibium sp. RKSG952 TaxID=2529384 RepID=UPI0013C898D8|nr:DsbA family protein [Roseibium sp. RKSG952]
MTISRRKFLKTTTVLAGAAAAATVPGISFADSVNEADLLKPGPLGDKIMGDPDAPVTIVEYASLTCGHCADFDQETLPQIKKEFIDTGKVRYIFREFPLDPIAAAASMLARCAPEDKYFDIIDLMFKEQRNWAFTNDPYNSLLNFSKQIGFTQESFEKCLTNQGLLDAVNGVRDRAAQEFGVNSTPTFFVNGERHVGALRFDEFKTIIDQQL